MRTLLAAVAAASLVLTTACDNHEHLHGTHTHADGTSHSHGAPTGNPTTQDAGTGGAGGGHGHSHGGGGGHAHADAGKGAGHGHSHAGKQPESGDSDHAHEEVSLGKIKLGELDVELAQGHGTVTPGKECHLVVKLPYNDKGESLIRAWIGTEDRTLSRVGKGTYAPSHDDYDVHAMAPDPLPENAQWWVEIEQPDGTKLLGAADLLE